MTDACSELIVILYIVSILVCIAICLRRITDSRAGQVATEANLEMQMASVSGNLSVDVPAIKKKKAAHLSKRSHVLDVKSVV